MGILKDPAPRIESLAGKLWAVLEKHQGESERDAWCEKMTAVAVAGALLLVKTGGSITDALGGVGLLGSQVREHIENYAAVPRGYDTILAMGAVPDNVDMVCNLVRAAEAARRASSEPRHIEIVVTDGLLVTRGSTMANDQVFKYETNLHWSSFEGAPHLLDTQVSLVLHHLLQAERANEQ